jgi:hypothetical protein
VRPHSDRKKERTTNDFPSANQHWGFLLPDLSIDDLLLARSTAPCDRAITNPYDITFTWHPTMNGRAVRRVTAVFRSEQTSAGVFWRLSNRLARIAS